jgi:cation:H+ antiporter
MSEPCGCSARNAPALVGSQPTSPKSNPRLATYTIACAAAILAAGFVLTRTAEAIAAQTGLETGMLGLTLLAISTSLPEVSTAIASVRLRRAELAIGDVLGGNMFDTVLILLVDVIYVGGLALEAVDRASMTMALLGVLLTSFFLLGLVKRRDRTIFNMGYDSFAVLTVYIGGMMTIIVGIGE